MNSPFEGLDFQSSPATLHIHMNSITGLSPKQLRQAADIKERIQSLEEELAQVLGATGEPFVEAAPKKKRLSAQGLANIRAGVRKRFGQANEGPTRAGRKRKRRMSAAGRARLSEIAKARWKKSRAQGKSTL
jgi:hypothetical protein